MHSYLQTKAVSLALEARYIRKQELKFAKKARSARDHNKDRSADWHEKNRVGQYLHRISAVREEARITNIARGFLKGVKYGEIERSAYDLPNWKRIKNLVSLYGERQNPRWNRPIEDVYDEWQREAEVHFYNNRLTHKAKEEVKVDSGV